MYSTPFPLPPSLSLFPCSAPLTLPPSLSCCCVRATRPEFPGCSEHCARCGLLWCSCAAVLVASSLVLIIFRLRLDGSLGPKAQTTLTAISTPVTRARDRFRDHAYGPNRIETNSKRQSIYMVAQWEACKNNGLRLEPDSCSRAFAWLVATLLQLRPLLAARAHRAEHVRGATLSIFRRRCRRLQLVLVIPASMAAACAMAFSRGLADSATRHSSAARGDIGSPTEARGGAARGDDE